MKAAVLNQLDSLPVYGNLPAPVPRNEEQVVIEMKAAALKNLDKLKTYSAYYAPYETLPTVVGTDGVGALPDGRLVYALGITGTMAQKALVATNRYTLLPNGIDPYLAAALPNAVLGSAIPLAVRAKMRPGNVIVINGATGITGKIDVQVAKHYGASVVVALGRNEETLRDLKELGADFTVSLNQSDEEIVEQLKSIDQRTPFDIVIDYLWGKPAELLIQSVVLTGGNPRASKVKFVTVGDMAGKDISLASGTLRSTNISLLGSGFGSLFPRVLQLFNTEILPEMFNLLAEERLKMETENIPLEEIAQAWKAETKGKRLVLTMD